MKVHRCCAAPAGSKLCQAYAITLPRPHSARNCGLKLAAAALPVPFDLQYPAAAQPLVIHERKVERMHLQRARFWSPMRSAPRMGSAAPATQRLPNTEQPLTKSTYGPLLAHRQPQVPRHREPHEAAVNLGTAVAHHALPVTVLLGGYALSQLAGPVIARLSAGVVHDKMKELLEEMTAAATAGAGVVRHGLQQVVSAAANAADTAAAVLLETVMVPVIWACHVLQCLIALVEVHTGMPRAADTKCTLRRFLCGVAAV